MMQLSIVITVRNRKEDLLRCLDSIKASDLSGISHEIIVVDDASTDGTELLKPLGFRFIHNKKQQMMVKSRNIGAKETTGDYVLFIDEDNVIDKHMIQILLTSAVKYPEFGILGPSMWFLSTKEKYLDYQTFNFYTGRTLGIIDTSGKDLCLSDGIPNVFMIKREMFLKYGYFDSSLIQTFTEPDYAFMLRDHGIKCGTVPSAITYHAVLPSSEFSPRSLGGMFTQKAYCLMRNRTVMIKRYGTVPQKTIYLIFFSWFWPTLYTVSMLKYGRFDLIKLYWLGYVDGLIYFFTGKLRSSL